MTKSRLFAGACLAFTLALTAPTRAQTPQHTASLEATQPNFAALSDEDFSGKPCRSGSLSEASNDRQGQFAYTNLVGDGDNPALSFFEDGTFAYLRLRLAGTPVQKPWNCPAVPDDYLEPFFWSVRLDMDHDDRTYETAVVVSDAGIALWANTDREANDADDAPEALVFQLPADRLCDRVEAKAAGTHIASGSPHGSEDWFLTVAVAIADLHAAADEASAQDVPSPLTGAFGLWGAASDTGTGFAGDRTCQDDGSGGATLSLASSVSEPAVVGTFVELLRLDGPRTTLTPTISGSTEVGNAITMTVRDAEDGVVESTAVTQDGGDFSFTPDGALVDGATYRFVASVSDGETPANSATDTIEVVIDTSDPVVTIDAPADDAIVRAADVELSGTVSDTEIDAVSVTVRDSDSVVQVPDVPAVVAGNTWTLAISGLADREVYAVEVTAEDTAGHSTTVASSFEVRTSVDAPSITSPGDGDTIGDATPRVSGLGEPEASVEVMADGGAFGPVTVTRTGTWSVEIGSVLPEGTRTLTATQTLGADVQTDTVEVTLDTAVALSVTTPLADARVVDRRPTFVGESDAGATVKIWLDGVLLGSVATDSAGAFAFTPIGFLTTGMHVLRAQAEDGAGNLSTLERAFTIADPETDSDDDGVSDLDEDVDGDGDPDNDDTDGDGTPDYLDEDDDGDGIATAAGHRDDSDGDGTPDYLDPDDDNDGVPTATEREHPDADTDGDGLVDYLDPDDDGDGVPTADEADDGDSDGDGLPDYLDPDDDDDGIPTWLESKDDSDADGKPDFLDRDDDGDGVPTDEELDDADNDGLPDHLDTDVVLPDASDPDDAGSMADAPDAGDADGDEAGAFGLTPPPSVGCSTAGGTGDGPGVLTFLALAGMLMRRRLRR